MRYLACLMIPLLLVSTAIAAQPDETSLALVSVEAAPENADIRTLTLSPNAQQLAWIDRREICVYTLADAAQSCTPLPDTFAGSASSLKWSPDGNYLVFYESLFVEALESDLWLLDVQNQTLLNRTDDSITGSYIGNDAALQDYTPVWAGHTLYFFRTTAQGDRHATALYRLPDLLSGDPELVTDFSPLTDEPFAAFEASTDTLAGAAALSPDGNALAFLLRNPGNEAMEVWLVDLADGTGEIVATAEDFTGIGLPNWVEGQPLYLNGLAWLPDQSGLIISSSVQGRRPTPFTAYQLDLASQQVTPLLDFSDLADEDSLMSADENGLTPIQQLPQGSFQIPDASATLIANYAADAFNFYWVQAGTAPIHVASAPVENFAPSAHSIGQDGSLIRVLFAGNIFTFEQP